MSTPEEIERLGQVAADAMAEYDRAYEAEKAATAVRVEAGKKWYAARGALDDAVLGFVKSKLPQSSAGEPLK